MLAPGSTQEGTDVVSLVLLGPPLAGIVALVVYTFAHTAGGAGGGRAAA